MIQWARSKGWGVRGHCLFWDVEDDSHYPDWVKVLTGQEMVNAIYHRLDTAINHYRVSLVYRFNTSAEKYSKQIFNWLINLIDKKT
jgi:GH35 family endo-1,4-beta-xylanase